MKSLEQIAKIAENSSQALQESAALCQKTIFECEKQDVMPASYHLAKKIQAVCASQIKKNKAILNNMNEDITSAK